MRTMMGAWPRRSSWRVASRTTSSPRCWHPMSPRRSAPKKRRVLRRMRTRIDIVRRHVQHGGGGDDTSSRVRYGLVHQVKTPQQRSRALSFQRSNYIFLSLKAEWKHSKNFWTRRKRSSSFKKTFIWCIFSSSQLMRHTIVYHQQLS